VIFLMRFTAPSAGIDGVDPGEGRGAAAVDQDLAEVADLFGVVGWRVSQPVTFRTAGGGGGAWRAT
jgi:hypothetical protein